MPRTVGRLGFASPTRAKLGLRPATPQPTPATALDFWLRRKDLNYFATGRHELQRHFPGTKSILDLGGGSSRFLQWFPNVPERAAADVNKHGNLYADDPGVRYIVTDGTLDQFEDESWEVVTAFQMIEHCDLTGDEILRIARRGAIISYPYKWDVPGDKLHHMRDEAWFLDRMGRKPDHQTVVTDRGARRNVTVFLKR